MRQSEVAEQPRHALQIGAPIGDGEILEQDQKRHRADQRHEMLAPAHPAPGEALDHERRGGDDDQRAKRGERPRHAWRISAQVAMPPIMNRPGMLKLRNFSTPMLSVNATPTMA